MTGGRITTHVLDTVQGRPAAGFRVELLRLEGQVRTPLADIRTNADGRCDAPLLSGAALISGVYELAFHAGAYQQAAAPFFDVIPIRFVVGDAGAHYHVPLVLSGHSYVTYRGS